MAEPIPSEQEKQLAERLKAEAQADRPAFSEALHDRIVRSVEEARVQPRPRPPTKWLGQPWLSVAIAGTLLIGGLVVAWQIRQRAQSVPVPSPGNLLVEHDSEPEPELPGEGPSEDVNPLEALAERTPEDVAPIVDSALTDPQWAYLDHDMKLAANLLMDQLPFELALAEPQQTAPVVGP